MKITHVALFCGLQYISIGWYFSNLSPCFHLCFLLVYFRIFHLLKYYSDCGTTVSKDGFPFYLEKKKSLYHNLQGSLLSDTHFILLLFITCYFCGSHHSSNTGLFASPTISLPVASVWRVLSPKNYTAFFITSFSFSPSFQTLLHSFPILDIIHLYFKFFLSNTYPLIICKYVCVYI